MQSVAPNVPTRSAGTSDYQLFDNLTAVVACPPNGG